LTIVSNESIRPSVATPDTRPSRPQPSEADARNILTGLTSLSQQAMTIPTPVAAAQVIPPVNGNAVNTTPAPPSDMQSQIALLQSVIPPHIASNPALVPQYLQLLQQLAERGVPPEQWKLVISILHQQQATTQPAIQPPIQERRRSRSPSLRSGNPSIVQDYRQRTPLRGGSPSLQLDEMPLVLKWSDYDPSIPNGCIKGERSSLYPIIYG